MGVPRKHAGLFGKRGCVIFKRRIENANSNMYGKVVGEGIFHNKNKTILIILNNPILNPLLDLKSAIMGVVEDV